MGLTLTLMFRCFTFYLIGAEVANDWLWMRDISDVVLIMLATTAFALGKDLKAVRFSLVIAIALVQLTGTLFPVRKISKKLPFLSKHPPPFPRACSTESSITISPKFS